MEPKKWRTGRKVGRTIYQQRSDNPADGDVLIGVMDTPELAKLVVDAVNAFSSPELPVPSPPAHPSHE